MGSGPRAAAVGRAEPSVTCDPAQRDDLPQRGAIRPNGCGPLHGRTRGRVRARVCQASATAIGDAGLSAPADVVATGVVPVLAPIALMM